MHVGPAALESTTALTGGIVALQTQDVLAWRAESRRCRRLAMFVLVDGRLRLCELHRARTAEHRPRQRQRGRRREFTEWPAPAPARRIAPRRRLIASARA